MNKFERLMQNRTTRRELFRGVFTVGVAASVGVGVGKAAEATMAAIGSDGARRQIDLEKRNIRTLKLKNRDTYRAIQSPNSGVFIVAVTPEPYDPKEEQEIINNISVLQGEKSLKDDQFNHALHQSERWLGLGVLKSLLQYIFTED